MNNTLFLKDLEPHIVDLRYYTRLYDNAIVDYNGEQITGKVKRIDEQGIIAETDGVSRFYNWHDVESVVHPPEPDRMLRKRTWLHLNGYLKDGDKTICDRCYNVLEDTLSKGT